MRYISALLFAGLFMLACNDDFATMAPFEDIPVVYNLIVLTDTAIYVRLERVFGDPEANASDLAQIPDSVFYPDNEITVELRNLTTAKTVVLQRVDGAIEGYPRTEGNFPNQPNYLYKVKTSVFGPLNGDNELQLTVYRKEKILTQATTRLVGTYSVNYAVIPAPLIFTNNNFTFSIFTDEQAAATYDWTMEFNYTENSFDNPTEFTPKKLFWLISNNEDRKTSFGQPAETTFFTNSSVDFYQYLANSIPPPNGLRRKFTGIRYIVDAGGKEILDYRKRLLANTGVTGTQAVPPYTNLSKGYGIFSSRITVASDLFNMSLGSRDSLYNGRFTKNLGFQP